MMILRLLGRVLKRLLLPSGNGRGCVGSCASAHRDFRSCARAGHCSHCHEVLLQLGVTMNPLRQLAHVMAVSIPSFAHDLTAIEEIVSSPVGGRATGRLPFFRHERHRRVIASVARLVGSLRWPSWLSSRRRYGLGQGFG